MSTSRSLTLIAPQMAPALAQAIMQGASRWPRLARLAGRGSIVQLAGLPDDLPREARVSELQPWQTALLDALGISGGNEHERYPSAAVTWSGEINECAGGFWMHAVPMHFSAGLEHLTAVALQGDTRVAHAERAELEPTIAAHLRASGLELRTASNGDWLVRSERAMEVRTVSPQIATRVPLDQAMPQGRDAAALRRLMTELQMLLHEHPVSAQRVRRGVPEVNAIWFYGGGAIGEVSRRALPQAFGDDRYLRGIYRLNDVGVAPAPADAKALLSRIGSRAIVVLATDDLDTLEALWLAPLARALAVGVLGRVDVVLDRWQLAIPRGALLRFWRPRRPPAEWAAC